MSQPVGGVREQILPDGAEIERLRAQPDPPTFAQIGEQYGVSRQSVHKALKKHMQAKQSKALRNAQRQAERVEQREADRR